MQEGRRQRRPRPDRPRPEQPKPPETPKSDEPKAPSPALKLYKEKAGFANYYFNEQAQQTLLAGFARHGDFGTLTGAWKLEGELGRKGGTKAAVKLEVVE